MYIPSIPALFQGPPTQDLEVETLVVVVNKKNREMWEKLAPPDDLPLTTSASLSSLNLNCLLRSNCTTC